MAARLCAVRPSLAPQDGRRVDDHGQWRRVPAVQAGYDDPRPVRHLREGLDRLLHAHAPEGVASGTTDLEAGAGAIPVVATSATRIEVRRFC